MTQRITQIPRLQADRYRGKKNLFLVPNYVGAPGIPDQGRELIERYWSDVRDSIVNLERSLGAVSKVYHEMVCDDSEQGIRHIELLNPDGCSLIRAICQSGGALRPLEGFQSTLSDRIANRGAAHSRQPVKS